MKTHWGRRREIRGNGKEEIEDDKSRLGHGHGRVSSASDARAWKTAATTTTRRPRFKGKARACAWVWAWTVVVALVVLGLWGGGRRALRTRRDVRTQAKYLSVRPTRYAPPAALHPDTKYLGYWPHSGFHNQRIALQNAIDLARLTNRTLLLPPIWLGLGIPWIGFDKLYTRLLQANKIGLAHCPRMARARGLLPVECLRYFEYTMVSWDFLVDLKSLAGQIKFVDRWSFSFDWLKESLAIEEGDIDMIKDETTYHYQISDSSGQTLGAQYRTSLQLEALQQSDKKCLHFGSLFGSERLQWTAQAHKDGSVMTKRAMVLTNPILAETSEEMARLMRGRGRRYMGLHLRVAEAFFAELARENMREILRKLLLSTLEMEKTVALRLLKGHFTLSIEDGEYLDRMGASQEVLRPATSSLSTAQGQGQGPCRLTLDETYPELATPLYIATDSPDPRNDPSLAPFFDLFPCSAVLGDPLFETALTGLGGIVNAEDGVSLEGFFVPFLDAMVAAKGAQTLGTRQSTFSGYATKILHPVYSGRDPL